MKLPLTLALLACATAAVAQTWTFAPGTRLVCRLDTVPTDQWIDFPGPGIYADQSGGPGGYIWDHRGFDFISGPFAGLPAEARANVLRLTPPDLAGRTLVCSP